MITRARSVVALWALGVAGCLVTGDAALDQGGPQNPAADCVVDEDCAPAASSCCECPTFAVAAGGEYAEACEDVGCDGPLDCSPTSAVCEAGACALRCEPIACEQVCAMGFVRDVSGCLVCECTGAAPPQTPECVEDTDCVQAPADCCGCARGGDDTAVPASELGMHTAGLGCDGSTSCPEVDVCDPTLGPRCASGTCVLAAGGGGGEDAPDAGSGGVVDPAPEDTYCGAPDLPPCPAGTVCVINDSDDANTRGVGVCRPE